MEEEERENEDVDPPIIKNESITTDTNSVKNETIINVVEEEEQKLPTNNNNNNLNKKRKLLPADSLVEHNINKHQRQLSDYHNDNNKKKNNYKYGYPNNMHQIQQQQPIITQKYEIKRQKYKVLQHRRRYVIQELNLPKNLNYWSIEDVADWIGYIGFPNYQEIMFENNINGEVLGSLTKADLGDMNIRAIGDRILILNGIEALKRSNNITNIINNKIDNDDNVNNRKNAQYLQYLKEKENRENQRKLYVHQQQEQMRQQHLQLQQGEIPLSRNNVPDLNFSKITDQYGNNNNGGVTSDSARSSASSAWGRTDSSRSSTFGGLMSAFSMPSAKTMAKGSWNRPKKQKKLKPMPSILSSRNVDEKRGEKKKSGWENSNCDGSWQSDDTTNSNETKKRNNNEKKMKGSYVMQSKNEIEQKPIKRSTLLDQVEIPDDCSMTTASDATEARMMRYRNRAGAIAVVINLVLLFTNAQFWWKIFGVFPALMALMMGLQAKAKMWINLGVQGRSPTEAWGTTNGNLSLMKGMNGDEKALDNVSTLIIDEYRRMMIIKKARDLNLLTVFLTLIMSVGVLVLAYFIQPVIHPKPLYASCPIDPNNHLICGGYTSCSGTSFSIINGTNTCTSDCFCDCPIDRDGNACELFAYGMPVAIFVIIFMLSGSLKNVIEGYCGADIKRLQRGHH